MTRDEILNMEAGPEMDALVAEKVMGWHLETDDKGWKYWTDDTGLYYQGCVQHEDDFEDEEDFHILHWHPSESILWAFEVVEKMRYKRIIHNPEFSPLWEAHLTCDSGYGDATAPTLSLAICRAALLAVMEE